MNIKDYLHLYISPDTKLICVKEPMVWDENGLKSWLKPGDWLPVSPIILHQLDLYEVFDCFKPLLRPLSDMTEEEAVALVLEAVGAKAEFIKWHTESGEIGGFEWQSDHYRKGQRHNTWYESFEPEGTRYLLSRGFDLFGLIPAGLALDKTTYQSPQIQQP
jgi:hypothetical protein